MAIGQESKVTDVNRARGQDVEQKTARELGRLQGHRFRTAAIGVIFPFETDASVPQREQVPIGNRNAVRVARQIFQNLLLASG
jgi:hypothetical protein